jgi:hypothetical protein
VSKRARKDTKTRKHENRTSINFPGNGRSTALAGTYSRRAHNCDNLIFNLRAALDALGDRLFDANRTIGQPTKFASIFGRKVTKRYRGKLETLIENLDLPNPVHPELLPRRLHSSSRLTRAPASNRGCTSVLRGPPEAELAARSA